MTSGSEETESFIFNCGARVLSWWRGMICCASWEISWEEGCYCNGLGALKVVTKSEKYFFSLEIFFWLQAQQPQNYARYMVTCRCEKWLSGRLFKTPKWCWMEVLATNFILDGSVDSDEQISAYRWCCGLRMQVVLTHSWDNMPHNISGWVGCVEEV